MAYSEQKISEALAVLAAHDGNANATRRALREAGWDSVPAHKTLMRWQASEHQPTSRRGEAIEEKARAKKRDLADTLEVYARDVLDDLADPARRDEASYRDLVGGFKVAVDKMQLLRGEATDINEERGNNVRIFQQINAEHEG